MSREYIARIGEEAVFRPRGRLWELSDLHVPFDTLSGTEEYERRAVTRLTQGTCVAVLGPTGTGKSSVISWICAQLPDDHVALRIPVTGVEDPSSVGEVSKLALSITLDEIALESDGEGELEAARADTRKSARSPVGFSAKLGGGAIPAEVGISTESLRQEFEEDRLEGESFLALNGRLVPILDEVGVTPVFVFEDTEATVGADDAHEMAEGFFAGPLSAFVEGVDAPTLVAVQSHLTESSRAFARLAPGLQQLSIPVFADRGRRVVDSVLVRRLERFGFDLTPGSLFDDEALDQLGSFYEGSGGDLRRVLAAAHEATENAASDGAEIVTAPQVRLGVGQWT